jgi:rubredoxin
MAIRGGIGNTPLNRLRDHYERTRMRCSACGHVDTEGRWTAATTGSEITYEHVCPSCRYTDRVVIQT